MNEQQTQRLVQLIEDELYNLGPSWFTDLASALNILEPYVTKDVNTDTPEQVDRATIRIVLMLLSFEEMIGLDYGKLVELVGELYPLVKEKAENMQAAIAMRWAEPEQA